jgi:periplasmic protein TonB
LTDPVLRVLATRSNLVDEGYSRSLLLSGAAHATLFFAILVSALLASREPLIKIAIVQAIPLPRGGEAARPAEIAKAAPEPAAPAPKPEVKEPPKPAPAPLLVKPKTEVVKKGVAPVDQKTSVKERPAESREIAQEKVTKASAPPTAAPTAGTGTSQAGLDFLPNPGTVDGMEGVSGPLAFYLAAAKNRIWGNWLRQIRPDFNGVVSITFTIHRDGSINNVEIIESSGTLAVDRLAERAVLSTQLGPLPNSYEKDTLVINANFKPAR